MAHRQVSFSWFERTDIMLSTIGSRAPLAGATSSKQAPLRVCHTCYEIYVAEMKLLKAERLYERLVSQPLSSWIMAMIRMIMA